MKENKDTACEPCEQNFERNINRLVKEGKAPTPKARQQKAVSYTHLRAHET